MQEPPSRAFGVAIGDQQGLLLLPKSPMNPVRHGPHVVGDDEQSTLCKEPHLGADEQSILFTTSSAGARPSFRAVGFALELFPSKAVRIFPTTLAPAGRTIAKAVAGVIAIIESYTHSVQLRPKLFADSPAGKRA